MKSTMFKVMATCFTNPVILSGKALGMAGRCVKKTGALIEGTGQAVELSGHVAKLSCLEKAATCEKISREAKISKLDSLLTAKLSKLGAAQAAARARHEARTAEAKSWVPQAVTAMEIAAAEMVQPA